jgi:hypothetical protein
MSDEMTGLIFIVILILCAIGSQLDETKKKNKELNDKLDNLYIDSLLRKRK